MKTLVLVLPSAVDASEDVFRSLPGVFRYLTERSQVGRLSSAGQVAAPEIAWFGLDPGQHRVASGPVIVAALGKEPPPGSVHFHLSLASLTSDTMATPEPPSQEECEDLESVLPRLDTRTMTTKWGEGLDHALVWESGSLDLGTTPVAVANGKVIRNVLPEGDGETQLRRLIDDSVNLLSDTDLNKRREDEGRQPLNILWPWGHGFRPSWPNLSLLRGYELAVESRSLRLAGLSRLLSARHGDRAAFGRPLSVNADRLLDRILSGTHLLVVAENVGTATVAGRPYEAQRMLAELGERLLGPLVEAGDTALLILATDSSGGEGIWLFYDPRSTVVNHVPFDGEVIGDTKVPLKLDWELVAAVLRP